MRQHIRKTTIDYVSIFIMISYISLASLAYAGEPGFAPCPLAGDGTTITAPSNSLIVRILSASTKSGIDTDIWPFVDRADVYGEVTIDGETFPLPLVDGSDRPHWDPGQGRFLKLVSSNPVPIQIRLFDDDGGASGGRDIIDINPDSTKRELDLTFDMCSFRIGGDIEAAGQDIVFLAGDAGSGSEQGNIVFKIEKENGRPESEGDIALIGVDLVQVVHETPTMIAGKPTVVMVQVASNYPSAVEPDIYLHIIAGDVGTITEDTFRITPPLQPNEVRKIYFYKDTPLLIPDPGSSGQGILIYARLDPDRIFNKGMPDEDCRVINDAVGTDIKNGLSRNIVRTRPLDLVWCKTGTSLDYLSLVDDFRFNSFRDFGTAFIKGTYPVSGVVSTSFPLNCVPPAVGTVYSWVSTFLSEIGIPLEWAEPFLMLFELNGWAAISGFTSPEERVIGVLPPGFFDRYEFFGEVNPWETTNGVSLGEAATHAVLALPLQPGPSAGEMPGLSLAVPAHELGHGFGLSVDTRLKNWTCGIDEFIFKLICGATGALDEYEHDDPALAEGNPSTGFWIRQGGEPTELLDSGMVNFEQCDSNCFMGPGLANMQDNWGSRKRWIDSADYEQLIMKLAYPSFPFGGAGVTPFFMEADALKTEGVIYLSGMIDFKDRMLLGPWYRLPSQMEADRKPGDDGFYLARFLDSQGSVLQEVSIPIHWPVSDLGVELPVTMFGVTMPYPVDTDSIQIWNPYNQLLLAEKKISPNPPDVELKFNKNKYGTVVRGEIIPLEWKAVDVDKKDKDKLGLEHAVLLSNDGKKWMPAAYRLDKSKFDLSTQPLPPGIYYLKIAVSDEANIGTSEAIQFEILQ